MTPPRRQPKHIAGTGPDRAAAREETREDERLLEIAMALAESLGGRPAAPAGETKDYGPIPEMAEKLRAIVEEDKAKKSKKPPLH